MKIEVIGRKYADVATYYSYDTDKQFPHFEKVDEQTWEIDGATLYDGETWLAENHPDMFMGGNVICENGDFAMLAIPCVEYGKGNYETTEARVAYVKAQFEIK